MTGLRLFCLFAWTSDFKLVGICAVIFFTNCICKVSKGPFDRLWKHMYQYTIDHDRSDIY